MAKPCRAWWRNCAVEADQEILLIDKMEDDIGPFDADAVNVRELISSLELCHHKAQRWIENIIEAIGTGETKKGLGTRIHSPGKIHPHEKVWQNACTTLLDWCDGCPSASTDSVKGDVPPLQMLTHLGERTPLKEWQVRRVTEKIRSSIHWPQPIDDPTRQYKWLLLGGGNYESVYRTQCPEYYNDSKEFWLRTVRTIIHDTENGDRAELSLGLAIDMLWPCHWRFVDNLQIVLDAIGGKLNPTTPFAACARNIHLLPVRPQIEIVSNTLNVFITAHKSKKGVDKHLLLRLGNPSEVKKWLAASLDKTIRLQLDPPPELREMSALAGPDWIKQ